MRRRRSGPYEQTARGLQWVGRARKLATAVLIVAAVATALAADGGSHGRDDDRDGNRRDGHDGRDGGDAYAIGLWGDLPVLDPAGDRGCAESDRRHEQTGTGYLWNRRPRLADLVDVWEAANHDVSVTSLKHHPYVANDDFHRLDRLYSWKTLVRCEKNWDAIARTLKANVDIAMMLDRNASCAA